MAKKLSKKDTTPEDEAREAEFRASLAAKKCEHFEPQTRISAKQGRGTVLAREGKKLTVQWDDGTVSDIYPTALSRF